jgi:hypothetical protein
MTQGHCWNTLLQQYPRSLLAHNELGSHYRNFGYHCCPFLCLLSKSDVSPQFLWTVISNEATCWRHRPLCGVKTNFEMSVFSKTCTFPIMFLNLFRTFFEITENYDLLWNTDYLSGGSGKIKITRQKFWPESFRLGNSALSATSQRSVGRWC